jgi:hypothetical protein
MQKGSPNLVPYVATTKDEKWEDLASTVLSFSAIFSTLSYIFFIAPFLFSLGMGTGLLFVIVSYAITFAIFCLGFIIYLRYEGKVKSETLHTVGSWLMVIGFIAFILSMMGDWGSSGLRMVTGAISGLLLFAGISIR